MWLSASLLWSVSACTPLPDEGEETAESVVEAAPQALTLTSGLPLLRPTPACSNTAIWVGPPGMRKCPVVPAAPTGTFRGEPLFGSDAPPELLRTCVYEWTPTALFANPDLSFLTAQLSNSGMPAPELDCAVVSALGAPPPIATELWTALERQTVTQASRPAARYSVAGPVRVAVLDSAALPYERGADFDNYGHGRVVGRLIDELACPPSMAATCGVTIENVLSLPLKKPRTPPEPRGGIFGTRGQLARAVYRAVWEWGKQRGVPGIASEHLILNMSVGWDPYHGGASGVEATMNPASRSVFQALKRAACLGAANVAAAGNADPGSRDGAMLPGGWQNVALPAASACTGYVGIAGDAALLSDVRPTTRATYSTLVTAAGAVDQQDRPLTLTRMSSTPHMVAYGLNAITSDPLSTHTLSLTGTSVSTAVLSAALATVWSIDPDLSAADALDVVYRSAVPLLDSAGRSRRAELTQPGVTLYTKRVSVCDAARLAMCMNDGCAVGFTCATPQAGAGRLIAGPTLVRDAAPATVPSATCGEGACIENRPYVRTPWVGPQPGRPGCPSCVVDRLRGLVRLTFPEVTGIRAVTVEVDGTSYRVDRPRGATSYPSELSIAAGGTGTTRANVLIDAEDETGRSVRSEPLSVF